MNIKYYLTGIATTLMAFGLFTFQTRAEVLPTVDFEPSTYTLGNINGQDGWTKTGPFDSTVVTNSYGYTAFGTQSLRISNSVTSGSFGDQTFAKPLANAVGEVDSTDGSFSRGTLQSHFEAQFDLASTMTTHQPGMSLSVSPDRGDGSRMSYLRFVDETDGIHVYFDDVQGTGTSANFVETDIATLSRSVPHTVKFVMDLKDGASNDVVKVYIDDVLEITGTSWENYYRYDAESVAEPTPRIVKTLLFRAAGTAVPTNAGNGFLFDNVSLTSSIPEMPSVPTITSPANGAEVTVSNMTEIDWTDSTGTYSPFEYQYQSFTDAGYTVLAYSSGWLTDSEIPTPGTPPGSYYVQVRSRDAEGNLSAWSNDSTTPYLITVVADTVLVGPPTSKDQCKKDGWMTFNNPTFKNQGACVSYLQSNEKAGKRN